MSQLKLFYSFGIFYLVGLWFVTCENVLSEVHSDLKEKEDLDFLSKKLKDMYIVDQLKQLKSIRNNLVRFLNDEEYEEMISEGLHFSDIKNKKSVILPRIGRSPIVFPRIGNIRRAVFQPRVGRNYDTFESDENDDLFLNEEKRIAFKPRIG